MQLTTLPARARTTLALADEAFARDQRIKAKGREKEKLSQDQLIDLYWFWTNPSGLKTLGYETIYEYVRDPEVAQALWGNPALGTLSPHHVNRYYRLVESQMKLKAEDGINLFDMPNGVASSGALALVEAAVDAVPPTDSPARQAAIAAVKQVVETVSNNTWRANRDLAANGRASEWGMDESRGMIYYQPMRGARVDVLELVPEYAQYGAEIVHRLFRPSGDFTLEPDAIVVWKDGEPHKVARVKTQRQGLLNIIADALRAKRR